MGELHIAQSHVPKREFAHLDVNLAVNDEPCHKVKLGRVALLVADEEREVAFFVRSVGSLRLKPEPGIEVLSNAVQAELIGDLREPFLYEAVCKAIQGRDRRAVL